MEDRITRLESTVAALVRELQASEQRADDQEARIEELEKTVSRLDKGWDIR